MRCIKLWAAALLMALLAAVPAALGETESPWLVQVYVIGSTLEENGVASSDIQEIRDAAPAGTEILLCTGGVEQWTDADLAEQEGCCIWRIADGEIQFLQSMGERNMCEPGTLAEFLRYGEEYDANCRRGLILWDHGYGPLGGFGKDPRYEADTLSLAELEAAFADCQPFEFIGIDACFMSTLEVAQALGQHTSYLVASELRETEVGWDYSFLKAFDPALSADEACRLMVDSYRMFYEEKFADYPEFMDTVSLSAIRTDALDAVASAAERFFSALTDSMNLGGYNNVARVCSSRNSAGAATISVENCLTDMRGLAEDFEPYYPDESGLLMAALDEAVVHHWSSQRGWAGLSLYLPSIKNQELQAEKGAEYKPFSKAYGNFIQSFTAKWGTSAAEFGRKLSRSGNIISYEMTPEQQEVFAGAWVELFMQMNDGDKPDSLCYWIGEDGGIAPDDQGVLHYEFHHEGLWLTSDTWESDKSMLLPLFYSGQDQLLTRYYARIWRDDFMYWDGGSAPFPFLEAGIMQIGVNAEGETLLLRIASEEESGKMREWKNLSLLQSYIPGYRPTCYDDGTLRPIDEWDFQIMRGYERSFASLQSEPLKLEWLPYPEEWSLFMLFHIQDTNGVIHTSDFISIRGDLPPRLKISETTQDTTYLDYNSAYSPNVFGEIYRDVP